MKKIAFILVVILIVAYFLGDKYSGPIVSQNGISVHELASQIITKYDVDTSGMIEVSEETFLRENLGKVIKTESRGLLFTDADEFGNSNGIVTHEELESYLKEFDKDNDGELTTYKNIIYSVFNGTSEWSHFSEKYQEKYKYD